MKGRCKVIDYGHVSLANRQISNPALIVLPPPPPLVIHPPITTFGPEGRKKNILSQHLHFESNDKRKTNIPSSSSSSSSPDVDLCESSNQSNYLMFKLKNSKIEESGNGFDFAQSKLKFKIQDNYHGTVVIISEKVIELGIKENRKTNLFHFSVIKYKIQ
ncbi:hypothetical protein BLOT_010387, partial [Blomia tropicalis]